MSVVDTTTRASTRMPRVGAMAEDHDGPPPRRAGDYRLTAQLGSGGCGSVYAAEHIELGSRAAIKIIRTDLADHREFTGRFAREVRALNRLRHPNIVEVFDVGELDDGRPYFVMELVDGKNLATLLAEHGRFGVDEAVAIVEQVARAVGTAHDANVVHRDLKARNIMIVRYAHRYTVKLLDFGVAKLLEPESGEHGLSTTGTILGTPVAMSPEQIRGDEVDHRADIYALGLLTYQLLTGSYAYYADHDPELFRMHLEAPIPRPSAAAPVSVAFDHVVAKAMAKSPDDRYPDAAAFVAALRQAADPGRIVATTPPRSPPCVAIRVDMHPDPNAADTNDDWLDDWLLVHDLCDEVLDEFDLAFGPVCASGRSLIAVVPLDMHDKGSDVARRSIDAAQALLAAIEEHFASEAEWHIRVSVERFDDEAAASAREDDDAVVATRSRGLEVGPHLATSLRDAA